MKKQIILAALTMGVYAAQAQQSITPYTLEVTHNNTTHIIFPEAVAYVDLGSANLVAGKADGAESVVRVKAANVGFTEQTNMSVITANGNFYSFDVVYSEQPRTLNVDLSGDATALDIQLKELGNDSAKVVQQVMRRIYDENLTYLRGVGSRGLGVEYLLKSICISDGVIYLHTELANATPVRFDIDYISLKIEDRKVAKRTAIQELPITPLRTYHEIQSVEGESRERTIYALKKFTIPSTKQLTIELKERNGGRHQKINIRSRELLNPQKIQ
ncbi:MAG: conjugative transposon protein TraN [Rikenellaceae bacterium]